MTPWYELTPGSHVLFIRDRDWWCIGCSISQSLNDVCSDSACSGHRQLLVATLCRRRISATWKEPSSLFYSWRWHHFCVQTFDCYQRSNASDVARCSAMCPADFLFFCWHSAAITWLCSAVSIAGGIILAPVYWNASNPMWVQLLLFFAMSSVRFVSWAFVVRLYMQVIAYKDLIFFTF